MATFDTTSPAGPATPRGRHASLLMLLRHARAGWAEPGMRDFDRPLTQSGRSDAEAVGRAMRAAGHVPDRVLCSTARRARETWQAVAPLLGHDAAAAEFMDGLYHEDAAFYLAAVRRQTADASALLLVGHNPMIEDLALALAGEEAGGGHPVLRSGFPAAGLAVIALADALAGAAPREGRLEAFLAPTA